MKTSTFQTIVSKFDYKGGMYYLPVPADEFAKFKQSKPARLLCSTKDGAQWKAGLMSMGNGTGFITVSTASLKKNGWRPGTKLSLSIQDDIDEEVFPMPEEMAAVLEMDDEANTFFRELTPGKQRGLIHYISTAKSSQVRIDRSLLLAKNLIRLKGKGTVPELIRKS